MWVHGICKRRFASLLPKSSRMCAQEFDSVDAAQFAYESEGREQIHFGDGQLLHMEYSHAPLNNPSSQSSSAFDWICTMCQATNFARCAH